MFKKIFLIVIAGFILNFLVAFLFVKNFDKNQLTLDSDILTLDSDIHRPMDSDIHRSIHMMLKSDVAEYNIGAQKILNNYNNDKPLFTEEYYRSFLPQMIISAYFGLINEDIIVNKNEEVLTERTSIFATNNGKLGFFIFQILIYFVSVLLLFKILRIYFPDRYLLILLSLFCFEPSLNQYHSSFFTESIYISFLIVLIYFVLKNNKSKVDFLLIGILLGIMYAQRSVSIGLFIPVILFFIFSLKKNFFISIFSILLAMGIVISLIGYSNYKRMGIFYITPYQANISFFHYVAPVLIAKINKIKVRDAITVRNEMTNNWINDENIDMNSEKERLKLYKLQKNYGFKLILNNLTDFVKFHMWKSMQSMIIDPLQIYKQYYFNKGITNQDGERFWEYDPYYKKLFSFSIIYSSVFYLFSLIGFIKIVKDSVNNKIKKDLFIFYAFCILVILYFLAVSGWLGNSRYFSICMIFVFFFTAKGFDECIKFFKIKKL